MPASKRFIEQSGTLLPKLKNTMKEIIIKTQKQFDELPNSFTEYTRILIESEERIIINKAWENSSVEARGNSSVEARENSSVVARGNSSVEAYENVGVHLYSDYSTVILFAFSVCWKLAKGKIEKKSKTATIIEPKYKDGVIGWLEKEGIKNTKTVIVYKKVSKEFKTQENEKNETLWEIGTTLKHHDYKPELGECGENKFHACSKPYFCDEFRSEKKGDKYIALEVKQDNLYAWKNPQYSHKIAFGTGKVIYECDKFGKKI